MLNYEDVLRQVKSWLYEVGLFQLQGWENGLTIASKSNEFDLVTDIDKKSEDYFLKAIRREFPGHAVLSEESGAVPPLAASAAPSSAGVPAGAADYRWIIDPLDGTVNYAHRFPLFTISIALQHRGETVLGAVYVPYLKEMFHAIKGQGAFLNERRIAIATETELAKALLATGFPYDRGTDPDNNLNYFNHMLPIIGGISRSGTVAFDLCNVASGRVNGHWEIKLNLWDVAAATLIVEEAGGQVDFLNHAKGVSLIAGNRQLCEAIFGELSKVNEGLRRISHQDVFLR